jgi:uncharacterized protein DUF6265
MQWTNARSIGLTLMVAAAPSLLGAQTAPSAKQPSPAAASQPAATSPPASTLDALAWLRGCWMGAVNHREFREQWSPPRGGMMVGFSHTVLVAPKTQGALKDGGEAAGKAAIDRSKDETQDFEYLRLEARADGIYYVAVPSGKKEVAFKLSQVSEGQGAKIFTFTNLVDEFPQRIIYRRGSEGWLYAQVAGKPGVTLTRDVTYPMRHIDCATDAQLKD